jgi:hypothetical protein
MYEKGFLSDSDIEFLTEILPVIFDNTDYKRISAVGKDAASVSLVRADCVKMAKGILSKGLGGDNELQRILDEAEHDPLPEVRFAGAD